MEHTSPIANNTLSLGFSPCPNDTFMFDAMVHGKVDTEGLKFNVQMDDVETLNQRALKDGPDITKISFAAYAKVAEKYQLLDAGSALGNGAGPLLVSKISYLESHVFSLKVAIPGKNTTANFLFSFFFPGVTDKPEMIFSEIEDAVLSGNADAGVIIHENRFTYEDKGLKKICDLGELWEKETGHPIPLGGIAVRRDLPGAIKEKINRVMRKSVEFALADPGSGYNYVKKHAQEMDDDVRKRHIALYVNEFSIDLGPRGRKAVEVFFTKARQAGVARSIPENIFLKPSIEYSTL